MCMRDSYPYACVLRRTQSKRQQAPSALLAMRAHMFWGRLLEAGTAATKQESVLISNLEL